MKFRTIYSGSFPILSLILEPAADPASARSVHLILPTAMREIAESTRWTANHLSFSPGYRGPASLVDSTSRILELCNRAESAPRVPQACHCHDNDGGARSRYKQHRESTHEGRGVSGSIPRTIETTPRSSGMPPARFAPACTDSDFLIRFVKCLFSRALSIDRCFVFYLVPRYNISASRPSIFY